MSALVLALNPCIDAEWRVVHDGVTYEIAQLESQHSNRTARQAMLRRLE